MAVFVKYGDFLYPAKRTYWTRNVHAPDIAQFKDVTESEDHFIPLEELVTRLNTDLEEGLSEDQVESVRKMYGMNMLKSESDWFMPHDKGREAFFFSYIAIVFCFTIAILKYVYSPESFSLDIVYLGLLFLVLRIVTQYVACSQKRKSIKTMNSFKKLYPQYASVIREGKKKRIHVKEIVVGDLVLLKAGNKVPADIRITESWDLKVNESLVVGRKGAIPKGPECTNRDPTISRNVVFYGTICVQGYGQGIAIATAERTAFGQMMTMTKVRQKMSTNVYREIRKIIRSEGAITAAVCSVFLIIAVLRKFPWITVITLVLAQIIGSIPDILYATITASFHWAAKRMVFKHCLPKDYEAVDKLSSVTVICCDMLGTITQNRVTVVDIFLDGKMIAVEPSIDRSVVKLSPSPHDVTWEAFYRAASLCSTIASKSRRNRCIIKQGCSCDPTEVAVMEFLNSTSRRRFSTEKINQHRQRFKKVYEIPHNTISNYHVTIHDTSNSSHDEGYSYLMCMKGAIEMVLKFCSTALVNGEDIPIAELDDANFQKILENVMRRGERIIGFSDCKMPGDKYPQGYNFDNFVESDVAYMEFRFLGFAALMDPPRASIPEAVAKCKEAGIKVILMTSDHPISGKAIARQVGIISPHSETTEEIAKRLKITLKEVPRGHARAAVVTGSVLDAGEKDIGKILKTYDEVVFARTDPHQKLEVVSILQSKGEIVALAGKTMEDSIAMSKADIGIGMGMHGCDLTREIADVILLGDNFESIVGSIAEGRLIYENFRKAIVYVLSSNVPKISPLLVACILFVPFTMGPGFILCIMLIAEIFPVLYIATQKADADIMKGRRFGAMNFFDHRLIHKSYWQVGVIGFLSGLLAYFTIMARSGFLPNRIIGLAKKWEDPGINDLTDSFNQEWSYYSRKSLEYTCQTAFFLSIIVIQCFNFAICRTHIYKTPKLKLSKNLSLTIICIPGAQLLVISFLMYTPVISKALHFYPLKFTDWLMCLPFPLLLLILEELRRFFLRHSTRNQWLKRETF